MQQDNQTLSEQWAECVRFMNENPRVTGRSRGNIALCEPRGLMGSTLLVAVPSEVTREFLQHRPMSEILDDTVHRVFGADTLVAFVVDPELEMQPSPSRPPADTRRAGADRTHRAPADGGDEDGPAADEVTGEAGAAPGR